MVAGPILLVYVYILRVFDRTRKGWRGIINVVIKKKGTTVARKKRLKNAT